MKIVPHFPLWRLTLKCMMEIPVYYSDLDLTLDFKALLLLKYFLKISFCLSLSEFLELRLN